MLVGVWSRKFALPNIRYTNWRFLNRRFPNFPTKSLQNGDDSEVGGGFASFPIAFNGQSW